MSETDFQDDLLGLVRDELAKRRGGRDLICVSTSVPYSTLSKIASGHTKNPRINTLQVLANYFRANPVSQNEGVAQLTPQAGLSHAS